MGLLARLFGANRDDHAEVRPLWHAVVARARAPHWYAADGVADTVAGRFDAITLVLALVLLRMEQDEGLRHKTARLTELFVTDMDGQLRQSGAGDVVLSKQMGKLVSVLGGRLGALRTALADPENALLAAAAQRNVSLIEGADPALVAARLRSLAAALALVSGEQLLAGEIPA